MKKRATIFGRTPYNPFTGKYAGLYSFNDEVVTNELWPAKLQEELQPDGKVSVRRLNEYGEEYGEAIDVWILISKSEDIDVDMITLPYLGLDADGNEYEDIVMCCTDTNGDMFLAPGGSVAPPDPLIFVKALEQPQSDGKMSVKKIMPTLSATNNLSAFDMYMFGDKGSCTLSATANSYGLSSFTLFNSATGAGTSMVAGAVRNSTGGYDFISVQPVFIRTKPCEEAE